MSVGRPRGTEDVLPGEVEAWQYVESTARDVFLRYGYREIRIPIFEHSELFERGIGDTTDVVEKEMYTFTDKGGRSLSLRPEGTASAVRAYLENNLASLPAPAKLYYMGPMFRYERPQAGRFRQHHQLGAECIGSADPLADAEIISLAIAIFQGLGLRGFEVHLNSIGCPDCRPAYRHRLTEFVHPRLARLCESCQARSARNPLRLLDCKRERCRESMLEAPAAHENLCSSCNEHFEGVQHFLSLLNIGHCLNPRLVRGFDYYTKTVFEVLYTGLGAQDALCGGGRYDGLVEVCGGPPTPAVGFAGGIERVLLALERQGGGILPPGKPRFFVAHTGDDTRDQAVLLASQLRDRGLAVDTDLCRRTLKSQLKLAHRLGVSLTVIVGAEELQEGSVLVRDMAGGGQCKLSLDRLPGYLSGEHE